MGIGTVIDQRGLSNFSSIPGIGSRDFGFDLPFGRGSNADDEAGDELIVNEGGNGGSDSHHEVKSEVSDYFKKPLLKVKTVMPFILFPDELVVDKDKVTFIERTFFASEVVRSVSIKDILDVEVSCSLFFATVTISARFYPGDVICISYLKKADGIKVRNLIQKLQVTL